APVAGVAAKLWLEGKDGGGPVSSRIGVRKTSADGAFVAYLHIAKMAGGFRQERAGAAQDIGNFFLEMSGHGADANLSAFIFYIREVADAAEIDEDFGLHQ